MGKKILSIVPAPLLPIVSGGQKATYLRLNEMGKTNDIVVITDTNSPTEGHNFTLKPLIKHKKTKYLSLRSYHILKEQIKTEKPDILILEQTFMGLIVFLACKKTKTPYAVYNHNIEYLRFKSMRKFWWIFMFMLEKFTFRHAKALFFVTEFDKQKAIKMLNAKEEKCHVATYGVKQLKPILANKTEVEEVRKRHNISMDDKVFMFFGLLKYLPNLQALEFILKEVNPILQKTFTEPYKILICGGGLSESYNNLKDFEKDNVIYAGFVPDIDEYIRCADVILNPVLTGGGIKTKVVEALGFNKNVVSTETGAIGIEQEYCGDKLSIVTDNDWNKFTEQVISMCYNDSVIPDKFFTFYTWHATSNIINQNI